MFFIYKKFFTISLLTVIRVDRKMKKLKLGLPKGSLQDATVKVFERAGFRIYVSGVTLWEFIKIVYW